MYRQVKLASGNRRLVCGLQHNPRLRSGQRLKLVDSPRHWTVHVVYDETSEEPPDNLRVVESFG